MAAVCAVRGEGGKQGTNQVTCCAVLNKGEEGSDGDAGPHAQVCSATASSICNDKRVSGFSGGRGVVGSRGGPTEAEMDGRMDGWMQATRQRTHAHLLSGLSLVAQCLVSFPASSAAGHRRLEQLEESKRDTQKNNSPGSWPAPAASLSRPASFLDISSNGSRRGATFLIQSFIIAAPAPSLLFLSPGVAGTSGPAEYCLPRVPH